MQTQLISKIFLGLGCLTFLIFAGLQFNDAEQYGNSDAWSWIALYGITAVISVYLILRNITENWLFAWSGFAWGCFFFRLQDDQGNFHFDRLSPANYWNESQSQMIQQSNESSGLLFLAIWTIALIYLSRVKGR